MRKRVFAYKLGKLICNCLLIRQLHTATTITQAQNTPLMKKSIP